MGTHNQMALDRQGNTIVGVCNALQVCLVMQDWKVNTYLLYRNVLALLCISDDIITS
jgi:hypothetical protein